MYVEMVFAASGLSSLIVHIFPSFSKSGTLFFTLALVLFASAKLCAYDVLKKEMETRDRERDAVLAHERRKRTWILQRHPLYDSPDDFIHINDMDQLDRFFDRNRDDVDELDWDKDGKYIFADHKYYR